MCIIDTLTSTHSKDFSNDTTMKHMLGKFGKSIKWEIWFMHYPQDCCFCNTGTTNGKSYSLFQACWQASAVDVATSSFSIVGNNVELEFVNIILHKEMLFAIGMTPDHTYTYI